MATPGGGGQFVVRRHRAAPPPKTPSTPKLVLAAFQSPATIDFGEQHPDKEAVKTLVLSCPADAKRSATVEVVRTPTNVAARFEGGAQSITIERGDVAACALTWRPERPGGLRGAVAFRLDGKRRLSATVLGRCVEPPPPPPKKATPRPAGLVRRGVERRLDDRARAVAARRASDAVRETTVPDDASLRAWLDELLVGAASNKTTAPNAEFATAQKSERRRRCAAVWRSESLATARKNVVEEVAANRLVLRPELDVRCDQVLRAHVLGLFASIEGPWMKAALDAALPLRGDGSLKAQLADHLFGDAETAFARDEDNRGKNGKDGGVYGKQLGEELRKRCVAHVFALLHFLDAARSQDALPQHSRLFSASRKVVIEADQGPSQVTSTQQLARAFGRDCLAGEGDILPHLERLGMDLRFVQTPLHDYDWRVRDFGKDLRDGVRLARAVDVAAHNDKLESDVCAKLRVPAASRLPKLHNASAVIEALQGLGAIPDQSRASLNDWARAVVDGRPLLRTRDLVAALAARFSGAARTVDAGRLRREVGRLGGAQAWDGSTEKASLAQAAADAITVDETSTDENLARTSLTQWAAAVAAGCHCQGLDADGRCAPGFVRAAVQLYHPALSCDSDEAAVSMLGGVSLDVYAACLDASSSPPERVAWAFAARLAHRLLASRDALQAATKLGAFARATSARKKRPAPPPKRAASPTVLVFANTPPAPRQRKALAPRNDAPAPKPAAKPAVAFDVTPGAIPQPKPPATVRFAAATPAPRRSTIVAAPTPAPVRPTPAAFLTPAPRFAERAQLPPATAAAREKGLRRAATAATTMAAAWRRAATRLTLWRRAAAVHVQCYWRLSRLRRSSARRRSSGDGSVARLLAAKLCATKTTSVLLRSLGTLFLQRCGSGAGRLGRERRAARTVQALGRGGLGRAAARERRGAALALQCLVRRAFAFKVARSPRRDRRARLTFARGAVAVLAHEKAVRDEWQRHTVARVGRLRAYVGARTIQCLARRASAKSEVARLRVQAWNDLVQAEDDERREAIAAAESRRAAAESAAELAEARAAEVSAEAEAQALAAEEKARARAAEIEDKCRAEAEAKREAREAAAEEKRKEREARIEAAALAATERLAALRVEEENAREAAEAEFEARRAAEEQAAEEAAAQRLQDLKDAEEAAAARVAEAEEEARERVAAEAERVRLEDERRRAEAAAELRATEAAATARIEELREAEATARERAAADATQRAADEQRAREEATEKLRRAEAAAAARLEELRRAEDAARERAAQEAAARSAEEEAESQRRGAELRAAEEAAQKRLEALEKAEAEARSRIEEESVRRAQEAREATEAARSERLRADEAAAERLAELIAAEEGARERIEREAERCLGEEAAARDAAAAEIRAASEDAVARLEELREAEAANRAASDDAAAEKLRQAEASARQRLEELHQAEEAARERAAADAATRAAELRDAEEASQKRLEAIEQAEEEARSRIEEGAKRAAELEALREEAAREQAAAAEALATRQREALREQAAAAEARERHTAAREKAASQVTCPQEEVVEVAVSRAAAAPTQPAPKKRADVEARAKATAEAVARAQRAAAEATAARERVAAETAVREQEAARLAAERQRAKEAARIEAHARERRARVDAAKEARRRADSAARAAAEARARAARSAAEAETRRLRSAEQKLAESSQASEARRAARREEARLTARLQTSRSAIVAEEAMAAARLAARRAVDAAQRGTAAMREADALDTISLAQAEAKRVADAEQARLMEDIERKRAKAEQEAQRMKLEVARKRAEAEAEARRVQEELDAAKKAAADEKAHLEARLAEARRAADAEAAKLVDSRRESARARAAEARAAADALEAEGRAKRRAEQAAAAERAASEKRALAERRAEEEQAAAERRAADARRRAEAQAAAEKRALSARKAAQRRVLEAEERRAAEERAVEARLAEERRIAEERALEARLSAERRVEERKAQQEADRKAQEAAAQKLATRRAREAARGAEVVEVAVARRAAVPTQPPPKRRTPVKKSPPKRRQSLGRDRDLPPPSPPPATRKSAKKSPRRRASLGRDLPPPPPPPAARSDRSPLSPSNRRRPKKTPQKVTTATQMTPHPPVVAQRSISFESPLPAADAPCARPTPRPQLTPNSRVAKEAMRRRRLSAATPPQRTRKVFDAFDLTEESAARMIQSRWRCHDACWQFFLGLGAAVEIQRRFRGILARSPSRSPVRRGASLSPLRIARTVSAPAVVQQSTVVIAVAFPNEGVLITCQALVRGRRVRAVSYRRSPPLWSVRKRLDAAAKKATPSATLGARCRKALALVESGARLEDVRGACAALESSTRLSPSCCEALAASDGAIAALLKLARACNRSRPHVDLLTLMLRTLANVSERSPTLACRVAETEPCVDVLLDLVQVFRDRPVPFGIATGLLTTLSSADVGARNACCSPTATKRLASVAALLKLRDHHAQGAALAAFRRTLATA